MLRPTPMRFVSLVLLTSLFACGDNEGTNPDAPAGPDAAIDAAPDTCPALALGEPELHFNAFNQLAGIRYPIDDLDGHVLVVELRDDFNGGTAPLTTGSFDLAGTSLETCQHCTFIARENADGSLEAVSFQTEGTLALTTVTNPLEPLFVGSVTAQLRPTVNPDSECRRVDALAFDTTPAGGRCTTLTDCANELLEVCDPQTLLCVAPTCNIEFGGCTSSQFCIPQMESQFNGACYDICNPLANACSDDRACVQTGPQPNIGICLYKGGGDLGQTCEPQDATTACVSPHACSDVSNTCTAACNLFADGEPGCAADTRCSLFGRCEPPAIADTAALGETCSASAEFIAPCGVDALGFQGYCFSYRSEDPLRCEEACLDESDCASDQFCALRFTSGLGVCLPDPVCGDGVVGEVGEVCDDGDATNAGTCSGDCQTVNYAATCALATALTAGTSVSGDTLTGLDGFQSTCQLGRSRTELYTFDPATPGRLSITVTSATTTSVSILEDCDAAPTELQCDIRSQGEGAIVRQLTTADEITIGVAATTVLEEGPHTIRVDFVPEDCGDSIIAGNEVCDDGNETSLDGCRGDCREIEYAAACAAALPLSTTAANTGDTTTAPFLFENSCSGFVTGRDRLYTFTAPTAGTLSLSLDQGPNDLALAVFEGCGDPATMTELACSSVLGPNEEAEVTLTAGQTVTVVVDGFLADDAGPYSLAATFQ